MNTTLQFSQVIQHLTEKEVKWFVDYIEHRHRGLNIDGTELDEDKLESYPDFGFKIMNSENWGTYAWFFAEKNGNVGQVGETVQEFLLANRPSSWFTMTWADYAGSLSPGQFDGSGEFDGGGLFVTAEEIRMFHAVEWVRDQERDFAAQPL